MKLIKILLALSLLLMPTFVLASDWIIEGDRVYVNDTNVYLSAEPYNIKRPSYVYFDIETVSYSGFANLIWGFDSSNALPKSLDLYNPHNVTETKSYTCSEPYWYNYTSEHFWCWINQSIQNNQTGENTTEFHLVFDHDYDWASLQTDTAYWNETHVEYWTDVSDHIQGISYDFDAKDKWYYATDVPISAGQRYTLRAYIDVLGLGSVKTRYPINNEITGSYMTS